MKTSVVHKTIIYQNYIMNVILDYGKSIIYSKYSLIDLINYWITK